MKNIYIGIVLVLSLIVVKGCVTPFEPEEIKAIDNMIVIEGNILQNDITRVMISRSLALNAENVIDYVSKAIVWVENQNGVKYMGYETKQGKVIEYQINTIGINPSLQYKLCVNIGSKRYESDLIPILEAPPIDSIGYNVDTVKNSVTFYVNTHDQTNKTKYYKWSFTEDWEFKSQYMSYVRYDRETNKVLDIDLADNRYYCWGKGVSSSILIATTSNLSQDNVYQKSLVSMGSSDLRVNFLYSMELTQMAITRDAYIYWENIRKNSDDIGGIFAPQPSEIGGNIRCITKPAERVLGYISASKVTKKRIFANASDIKVYKDPKYCDPVIVNAQNPIPLHELWDTGYDIAYYSEMDNESLWAAKKCVDCRLLGSKVKPWFWPNDHK
ncbi:MAG: hypothetical protein A2X19_10055 [Bacteroidetes bacterium GWE2_39_28]|nr:MAG: hypothetical protein A2X19_10055 [Bacteroidetes bacterium GWE2_39_28]OFY15987.1 MAG: hypothetical protein A2X16_01100 [Bacteroidetes bacterium GWF2_39_10]OFZ07803.1 MAG: hypothetical protein A2322_02765 [Bacteroidetes bacterium RIFOXYB2_FULL_39_7]OFZ10934.1 MAG: hypothetical protein A2465_00975 [Bacteroidetes bacterium RIFOXYC2_FULL_39_11]HCT95243.1 hypothetical protein [Rikenellaceae bacterium]